jgi:hypothetical protein
MRFGLYAAGLMVAAGVGPTQAADCTIAGPRPQLDSQPIEWKLAIGSGQSCIRGLRSNAMILDSVKISEPAKFGDVTTQGYSFTYRAPREFKGDDTFAVAMSGTNRGVRGTSVILVHVSVR